MTDELVEILKDQLIKVGTKAVMKYIVSKVPFFSLSIPNFLASIVVEKVVSILIKYTELGAYFLYADMKTKKQAEDFEKASEILKQAKAKGDKDEITKSEQDLINAARELISLKR